MEIAGSTSPRSRPAAEGSPTPQCSESHEPVVTKNINEKTIIDQRSNYLKESYRPEMTPVLPDAVADTGLQVYGLRAVDVL